MRYMVGGTQNVVTLYFSSFSRIFSPSNLSKSYTSRAVSPIHWPYILPQKHFIQPESDTVKCRPPSTTRCQNTPVMM